MQILNQTPFALFSSKSLSATGELIDYCVLKGTYRYSPDCPAALAHEQHPINLVDCYLKPDGAGSLRFENDRVPFKSRGEIYFIDAVSRCPGGPQLSSWRASVAIGSIRYQFRVSGPSYWKRSLSGYWNRTRLEPVSEVPILYELAYGGGPDHEQVEKYESNPVGLSHNLCAYSSDTRELPAHQLEAIDQNQSDVVGLSPIHRAWTPRRKLAGTFDEAWKSTRAPLMPLDFDPDFFLAAPPHLKLKNAYFKGNENIELLAIGRYHSIKTQLSESRPIFLKVYDRKKASVNLAMHIDTVIFEPERNVLCMYWRVAFKLSPTAIVGAIGFSEN